MRQGQLQRVEELLKSCWDFRLFSAPFILPPVGSIVAAALLTARKL